MKQGSRQSVYRASSPCIILHADRCEGCAARLKSSLEAVEGVTAVSVDFSSKEVSIWLAARPARGAAAASAEALAHAIRSVDLSYAPELIEVPS